MKLNVAPLFLITWLCFSNWSLVALRLLCADVLNAVNPAVKLVKAGKADFVIESANPKNKVDAAPVLAAKNSAMLSRGVMNLVKSFNISEKATCSLEKEFSAPSAPSSNAEKLFANCLVTSSNTALLLWAIVSFDATKSFACA